MQWRSSEIGGSQVKAPAAKARVNNIPGQLCLASKKSRLAGQKRESSSNEDAGETASRELVSQEQARNLERSKISLVQP